MRILHCTVALVVLAAVAPQAAAAPPQETGAKPSSFTVFVQGRQIGTEEVTVTRGADGMTIGGTALLGPPLNLTIRRAQIRYTADGRPIDCTLEGSLQNQLLGVRTFVNGTTATTDATQGVQTTHKVDQVAADALLLPNAFFGGYEAMAARLRQRKTGDEIQAYVPPQAQIPVRVGAVSEETIRTPAGAVHVWRYSIEIMNPGRPITAEIWAETSGRLVRLLVPAQSVDYARNDIVSVASRREPVSHPGDEQVRIPANGFTLAGTLSKPASAGAKTAKPARGPAIVLAAVPGETDRDQTVAGVPIFGLLAGSLADAGFIVIRYDKRGLGQSGGRLETATLADHAEDVSAVVKFLRKRKDVDGKRVAVLGYAEGGAVALTAARADGDIRALVLVNAPGSSGADIVLEQQRRTLAGMSIPEAEKQAKIDLQKKIIQATLTGKGWEGIPPTVRRLADVPWFQSWLAFDPARVMRKVDQPILVVASALDREIPPSEGRLIEKLARARKGKAGQAVKLVEIAGVNHLLVGATTGEVDEYGRVPDKTVNTQVPAAVAGWLKEIWRE